MKNRALIYLSYLVLVSFVVTGVTFSRYETVLCGSDIANTAQAVIEYVPISATLNDVPISNVENGISIGEAKPGDELVYYFDINNYNNSDINQVLLKYKINISFDPSSTTLPLTYYLMPAESYESAGGSWIYLGFGSEETHSYMLIVSWDELSNGEEYLSQQQNIQIELDAEQVDSYP